MSRWLQWLFLLLAATVQASLPHAVKTVGSVRSYGYDANGNMISRYGQKLDYDSENRLASVQSLTFTSAKS